MTPDIALEIFLLLAVFFLLGCIIGCVVRRNWGLFGRGSETAATAQPAVRTSPKPAQSPATAKTTATAGSLAATKPRGRKQPRAAGADDLKRISGIGPVLEKKLNDLGYYHFDQIAAWSPENVAWVDQHLNFKGRIEREDWIAQARALAKADKD